MKASEFFVKCLEEHKVKYVFAVPGEENLHVLDALRKSPIEVIVTRNEQTAVFMAATYGRFTGKPGVAMATLGPGATNMMTGVAYAQLGGMPVVVITGQKPIKASKQARFQILDVVNMMKPVTKKATSIVDGRRISAIVNEAFKTASMERPGAVHIEFPEDISAEKLPKDIVRLPLDRNIRPVADRRSVDALRKKLEGAKRPVILIGAGANRTRITKHLTSFIEMYNIPFFTSQMGKGVVNESLSQCLGTAALTEKDLIHETIAMADLIVAVGHDSYEKPTHLMKKNKAELVHVNFFPSTIDEMYAPILDVVGDIGATFKTLCMNPLKAKREFSPIYRLNEKHQKAIKKHIKKSYKDSVMSPARLIDEIHQDSCNTGIVCLDNGFYKVWFARNYKACLPNSLLLDNALATMGAGYSSAMVAKIMHPEKDVVAVVGDGGLLMNLGDLETAVRLNLDLTIIVLNDNAYGMIKWKQRNIGYKEYSLNLQNPDFPKLADSFGAHCHKVIDPNDFKRVFEIARKEKGVSLIEVTFAYPKSII